MNPNVRAQNLPDYKIISNILQSSNMIQCELTYGSSRIQINEQVNRYQLVHCSYHEPYQWNALKLQDFIVRNLHIKTPYVE